MKRILLVDDEPHVISVVKHFLIKENYQVDTANNGAVALEKIKQQMPDVIVSDIQMPFMTGIELSNNVRLKFAEDNPLIIIMTSRTERDFREQAGNIDNVEFLEKPLSPRLLVVRLKEHFDQLECVV